MCVFVLVVCVATVGGVGLPLATSLGRRSPARYTDALGASCLGLRLLAVGVGCVCVLATSSIGLVALRVRSVLTNSSSKDCDHGGRSTTTLTFVSLIGGRHLPCVRSASTGRSRASSF